MRTGCRRLTATLLALTISAALAAPALAQVGADVAISKVADRHAVHVADPITYTIMVTNVGDATATNVLFGDSVPDALNFVSASCSGAVLVPLSYCSVPELAPGASATLTLVATPITTFGATDRRVTNTAFGDANNDVNAANRLASTTITISGPRIH